MKTEMEYSRICITLYKKLNILNVSKVSFKYFFSLLTFHKIKKDILLYNS